MRAVAAHRRALADAMRCRRGKLPSPSRWRSRADSGAVGTLQCTGCVGTGVPDRIGSPLRCVRCFVLVTFWGAVLELLSHLQQASPRGPSCLLNQSLPPVIRGPMHGCMQGLWTAQTSHLLLYSSTANWGVSAKQVARSCGTVGPSCKRLLRHSSSRTNPKPSQGLTYRKIAHSRLPMGT